MVSFRASMLIAVLGVAAHTQVAAAAPAWCDSAAMKKVNSWTAGGMDEVGSKDPLRAFPALVAQTCNPDRDADPKQVDAARASWSTRLDLTEADWADLAAWVALSQGERNGLNLKYFGTKLALSAHDPLDQFAAIAYTKYSAGDAHYLTDVLDTRLSEAGRLAYIRTCLDSRKPAEWAMCNDDILALDAKKLSAEIRSNKTRPAHERAMVRIVFEQMRPRIAERAAAVKELQAEEPGYAKLFEIASAARKSHRIPAETLSVALAMDDAAVTNSNKAYAGCDDKTWPVLKAAIAAIPASKFANLKDEPGNTFLDNVANVLVNDPAASVAAGAHVICHSADADALVQALAENMARWAGYRGPRNAALTAMMAANVELDQRGAQVEWPTIRRFGSVSGETIMFAGRGAVSGFKADGDKATVEFVKKLRKETVCTDWKDTNRVIAISPSGTFIYDYICTKHGTITKNDAPAPQKVHARYAEGVKVGTTVSVTTGVVAAVWAKGAAAPSFVLGVPVK